MKHRQYTFADMEINRGRKPSRVSVKLEQINSIVDWQALLDLVQIVDRTDSVKGGCPYKDLLVKVKMLFLQSLYNLSDPELEDQVNDRLSFQKFIGLDFSSTVPDYSTIWRFREHLIEHGINDKIFDMVLGILEDKGLLVKKGTIWMPP